MDIIRYKGYYIQHYADGNHEICHIFTDKELTNKLRDMYLLDVNGGCPYPVNIECAIKRRMDKYVTK